MCVAGSTGSIGVLIIDKHEMIVWVAVGLCAMKETGWVELKLDFSRRPFLPRVCLNRVSRSRKDIAYFVGIQIQSKASDGSNTSKRAVIARGSNATDE